MRTDVAGRFEILNKPPQPFTISDESGLPLTRYFASLPSKKKHLQYFEHVLEPIDFQTIDRNINTGFYTSADQFDRDVIRLYQNNLRYYGHFSREGGAALQIRNLYNTIKQEYHSALSEIVGEGGADIFRKRSEVKAPEDVIRCPCGQFTEEGTMIQCDKCQIWQHSDCVGREGDSAEDEEYLCETCGRREPILDISLLPQPEYAGPGEQYYISLVRGDGMQIHLGDTVYVLRAFKTKQDNDAGGKEDGNEGPAANDGSCHLGEERQLTAKESGTNHNGEVQQSESATPSFEKVAPENNDVEAAKQTDQPPLSSVSNEDSGKSGIEPNKKEVFSQGGIPHTMMSPSKGPSLVSSSLAKASYPTYKTVSPTISTSDMDIFRIERLWMNEKGERFAFGHHYLRPHETFHEPSRKFFRNEVFRVPIYEVLPLDTIWGQCWVLDTNTFCKGRPFGAVERHVYICEYRVDKGARLFNKISKPKHLICTKEYAFDHFDQKLRPTRTYTVRDIEDYLNRLL